MKKLALVMVPFLLVPLAMAACSMVASPPDDSRRLLATPSTQYSTVVVRPSTPTLEPASPTPVKPTATFVPLMTPSPTANIPRISVSEARAKANAGEAVIVDVRAATTYQQNHITGAISMPVDEIAERHTELPTDTLVVFYCA